MKILAVGDVVSEIGISMVKKHLSRIKSEEKIDFVVINGENACNLGITPDIANDLFAYGADVITLGNHAFKRREILDFLDENKYILRPHNFASQCPGTGYTIVNSCGMNILVTNLIGRTNMEVGPDNPFLCMDKILKQEQGNFDIAICDFHAEATSEKYAFAFYLDGRISVLFGTHTHIKTADTRIFDNGLGYITDVGMTGPYNSVIGINPSDSIKMFRGDIQEKFKVATGKGIFNATIFDIDNNTKKCTNVQNLTIIGE